MNPTELYADVLLPLAGGTFSYLIDQSLHGQIAEGMLVRAPLGKKSYPALIWRLYEQRPAFEKLREISTVIETDVRVSMSQMKLWQWIADYYMSSPGEVMKAALPVAFRPKSATSRGAGMQPEFIKIISFARKATRKELLDTLEKLEKKAPRQYEALLTMLELCGKTEPLDFRISLRTAGISPAVLRQLEKKGIIRISLIPASGPANDFDFALPNLSDCQHDALTEIGKVLDTTRPTLLFGITGSGKTEIYIHLIAEQIKKGKDVLYLLPEISMSGQLIERIKKIFGDRVIPYHSLLTDRRRGLNFRDASAKNRGRIIMGTRSTLFLPGDDLGLIIVDEEHDPSYKSSEAAPRLNARDAALMLGRITKSAVLLASATPSIETMWNAERGRYNLVKLTQRYGSFPQPTIKISDNMRAVSRGERNIHFNKEVIVAISDRLNKGEQVLLFQNRRGYAPYVSCPDCGWISTCPGCGVNMIWHKSVAQLQCHYCGANQSWPTRCPDCGSENVTTGGFGTEKIEDEIIKIFPGARVARLDRDIAVSAKKSRQVISNFANGTTDILIGTTMISKGFDFKNLSLGCILNADNLFTHPDFRNGERAFQLITQVCGRVGRHLPDGEVIIQTSNPGNKILTQVSSYDYWSFYRDQIAERSLFLFPPFCRLIKIEFRFHDNVLLEQAVGNVFGELYEIFGKRICSPILPVPEIVNGKHRLVMLLKIERTRSFSKAKKLLSDVLEGFKVRKGYRQIEISINVDPQ